MSNWTHLICCACWNKRNPEKAVSEAETEGGTPCCVCGKPTESGIYFREDPATLLCKGVTGEHG